MRLLLRRRGRLLRTKMLMWGAGVIASGAAGYLVRRMMISGRR